MNAHTRRTRILEILEQQGAVQVHALARSFNASFNTIRSDLDALEAEKRLQRVRGGAARLGEPVLDGSQRLPLQRSPRHCRTNDDGGPNAALGAAAAQLVADGDAIVLDDSPAACSLAHMLAEHRRLTVVTTGLSAALALAQEATNRVILAANELSAGGERVRGRLNDAQLEHFVARMAFVSAAGFTLDIGLTESSNEQAQQRRALLAHARTIVALLEADALQQVAAFRFAGAERVSRLIVAGPVDEATLKAFEEHNGLAVTVLSVPDATPFTAAGD